MRVQASIPPVVEAPVFAGRATDGGLDIRFTGHVCALENRLAAGGRALRNRFFTAV